MKPLHFRAVCIGSAVPRTDFDASVHSTFHTALNLRAAGHLPLLTLLASSQPDLPQSIRLAGGAGLCFETLPIGARATCRHAVLTFERIQLSIDFRGAPRWCGSLPSPSSDLNQPAVVKAWSCAWHAVNDRQRCLGIGLIASDLLNQRSSSRQAWIQHLHMGVRLLLHATAQYHVGDAAYLESLIGLGPGLTPAADDLLAGYLFGLRCVARGDPRRLSFLTELCEAVITRSGRTNDISRTYLLLAAGGQASRALTDLAVAICAAAPDSYVLATTGAALRSGHTSGMDAVTGLLLGLLAWSSHAAVAV